MVSWNTEAKSEHNMDLTLGISTSAPRIDSKIYFSLIENLALGKVIWELCDRMVVVVLRTVHASVRCDGLISSCLKADGCGCSENGSR
ncbi:hypothetical protein J6590_056704 [Homalodisca vitripennis]|nr:hypothetical protein J6590_056704 [Homalodisca vitripennis]